jgi:4-methoxybenzoate monooxygenase (O-demethylating)
MTSSDIDLFSDQNLEDPWQIHKELRDAGPAIYMTTHDIWAVPRYADVRKALKDWANFTSRFGVSVATEFNQFFEGTVLFVDPPRHTELSKVLRASLSPGALKQITAHVEERADAFVAELVECKEFDAIADLADRFPVEVVADLVGLPQDGRESLRRRAAASFNVFGPNNERSQATMGDFGELFEYISNGSSRDQLAAGSFGMALYEAVDAGELEERDIVNLMAAYLVAGMDTTVNALGSAVWLLAENPDQWRRVREDRSLVRNAFDEALRLESPIMGFTRTLVTDQEIDGQHLEAGQRILPLLTSANRDERQWQNPEVFDVTRDNSGHVAFGFGLHACTGRLLAHLEGQAILKSMVDRIDTMAVTGPVTRRLNNQVRGLNTLPLQVAPAKSRMVSAV